MTYTIQIEPAPNCIKTETKRQSLYSYIRSASKLVKMRTEIRKHRTLPNDAYQIKEKCLDEIDHYFDNNEKIEIIHSSKVDPLPNTIHTNSLSPPPSWSSRHPSQSTMQPSLAFTTSPASSHRSDTASQTEDEDEEYDLDVDEFESSDDDDFDDHDEDNEDVLDNYSLTLQKLSGITLTDNRSKKNTAVLITLSPCALAAANAARQRRQRIRINH